MENIAIEKKQIESPEWHNIVVKETNQRFNTEQEKSIDWQDVKKELRKKFDLK